MIEKCSYEINLWEKGCKYIAGVDEVGRGALAGPIVGAAVVWSTDILDWSNKKDLYENLMLIKDSKKVSIKRRKMLSEFIKIYSLAYAISEISNGEIDRIGIQEANKEVLRKAVLSVKSLKIEHVLTDHISLECGTFLYDETPIKGGDNLSLSIAAASIIAKVYRDNLMKTVYHEKYPLYGFDKHVGYGTKMHMEAIQKHGLCKIHRKSYHLNLQRYPIG